MATKQRTVDYILDQLSSLEGVLAKKMFGEYAIYYESKVVALVCDNQLFVKPTKAGKAVINNIEEAPPYKGAKPSYLISADLWDDAEWLSQLIKLSAAELPLPKTKIKIRSQPK